MYNNQSILFTIFLHPSKEDRLIVPNGCNTAAPELHLRPAVAKSPSTLDAFPGFAHSTPFAKVNAPANFHHPLYDCLRLSPMHYFLTFTICFFLLICNFFIRCRSFYFNFDASDASVCIFVLFAWFFLGVICQFDAATPVKSPTK